MPRVIHVNKARKENQEAGIRKGEEYWWAGYRLGYSSFKRYWKSLPRPSQVAASQYVSEVLAIAEEMMDAKPEDAADLEGMRDDWAERIREIGDDCRQKFVNLPDGFQMGDTGMLLEERADACEQWADDLEGAGLDRSDEDHTDDRVWDDFARDALAEMAIGCPE